MERKTFNRDVLVSWIEAHGWPVPRRRVDPDDYYCQLRKFTDPSAPDRVGYHLSRPITSMLDPYSGAQAVCLKIVEASGRTDLRDLYADYLRTVTNYYLKVVWKEAPLDEQGQAKRPKALTEVQRKALSSCLQAVAATEWDMTLDTFMAWVDEATALVRSA